MKTCLITILALSLGSSLFAKLPEDWEAKVQEGYFNPYSPTAEDQSDQFKMILGQEIRFHQNERIPMVFDPETNDRLFHAADESELDSYYENTIVQNARFEELVVNFEFARNKTMISKTRWGVAKFAGDIVLDVAATAGIASANPVGMFLGYGAKYVGKHVLGEFVAGIHKKNQLDDEKLLNKHLSLLVNDHPGIMEGEFQSADDILLSFNLHERVNDLVDRHDLTPGQRLAAQTNLNDLFIKKFVSIEQGVFKFKKEMRDTIANVQGDINTLGAAVARNRVYAEKFADMTQRRFSIVEANQKRFHNALGTMQTHISENRELIVSNASAIRGNRQVIIQHEMSIKFMQDAMYSKLSPSQRWALYEQGQYGTGWDPNDPKVAMLEAQATLESTVGDALDVINVGAEIAMALGVELTEDTQTALRYANAAFGSAMAFMSGNPLGAAMSIVKVFGGKKQSAAAQMHKQIMRALGVINQKLDAVLANQKIIIQNQQAIQEMLVQLSKQVEFHAGKTQEALAVIRDEVRYNREAIDDINSDAFAKCDLFHEDLADYLNVPEGLDDEIAPDIFGSMRVYRRLKKSSPYVRRQFHFARVNQFFDDCSGNFERVLSDIAQEDGEHAEAHSFFQLKQFSSGNNNVGDYIQKRYNKVVGYFLDGIDNIVTDKLNRKEVLIAAMSPVSRTLDADAIYETASELSEKKEEYNRNEYTVDNLYFYRIGSKFTPDRLEKLLREPLNVERLKLSTKMVIDTHVYFSLLNPDDTSKLLDIEELLAGRPAPTHARGRNWLNLLQKHVHIALGQQNILSGTPLLPILFKDFESEDVERNKKALEILDLSETIKSNFFKYYVVKKMKETNNSVVPHRYHTLKRVNISHRANRRLRKHLSNDERISYECIGKEIITSAKEVSKYDDLTKLLKDKSCTMKYSINDDVAVVEGVRCNDSETVAVSTPVELKKYRVVNEQACYMNFKIDDSSKRSFKMPRVLEVSIHEDMEKFDGFASHSANIRNLLSMKQRIEMELLGYKTEDAIYNDDNNPDVRVMDYRAMLFRAVGEN